MVVIVREQPPFSLLLDRADYWFFFFFFAASCGIDYEHWHFGIFQLEVTNG
jgi:hypothetical protein